MDRRDKLNILFISCGATGILLIFLILWNNYQSQKLKLYVDTNNQFTIKYPPDWTLSSDLAGAAVIFNSPLENKLDTRSENVNIVIVELSYLMKVIEFVKMNDSFDYY